MNATQKILRLFEEKGDSEYGGEAVTQLEHALQAATLALQAGAHPSLVVAALLHDVGHLLHDLPDDAPEVGIDDHHETTGFRFLEKSFPASVTEPVKMHVDAKRYLCAVDKEYFKGLSEPSRVSLELQGGPMDQREIDAFRSRPFSDDAVRLRQWDDQAKVPGQQTPPLERFSDMIDSVLLTDETN